MKPVFDENGLATVPGDMRCYYYDAVTVVMDRVPSLTSTTRTPWW
ncbi:Uncharacterised protein [Salmonella enterica subsp. enterica serovar Typhi]|nr:Uncharacterised protein [Salmonella enterica subsp. enterica serovar Typhi]